LSSQRKRFPNVVTIERIKLDRSGNKRSTDSENRRGSLAVEGITEIIPSKDRHSWGAKGTSVEMLLLD